MPRARRAGVQIAFLGGGLAVFTTGCFVYAAYARGQRFENRIEFSDRLFVAAYHHAIAALQSPDTAAGADIDIAYAFFLQRLSAAHIVLKIAITAVNQNVTASQ